jgi:hypothetical protein
MPNTAEQTLTKETQTQLIALDCLAQMIYLLHLTCEYCPYIAKRLPPSNLKDVVLYFGQNETNWKNKMLRALKGFKTGGVDLHAAMVKDLESAELPAYFDIMTNLKKARDLETIADLVGEMADVTDFSEIKGNLTALIRNQKYKEEAWHNPQQEQ